MSEVKFEVLKVINEVETRRGKTRLQIVRWGTGSPTLEKREYWMKEDEEMTGKAKGFNGDDFRMVVDQAEDIEKILDQK